MGITGALIMLKSVQFSSTSWSSPRSSAQRQRQNHEQMSNTISRHQDGHCHRPQTRLLYAPTCASSQGCGFALFKAKIWKKANRGMEIYFQFLLRPGFMWKTHPTLAIWESAGAELPALLLKGRSPLSGWFAMRLSWRIALGEGGGGSAKEGRKEIKPPSICVVTYAREGERQWGKVESQKAEEKIALPNRGKVKRLLRFYMRSPALQPLVAQSFSRALRGGEGFPTSQRQAP